MTLNISRREMIAWLAAGTGAAATGASVTLGRPARHSGAGASPPVDSNPSSGSTGTPAGSRASEVEVPATNQPGERLLVVVEMPGGNDGLSTVIPYANGTYYDFREQTAILAEDVLDFDGQVGLHPNLVNLHRRGVTVVEGVGSFDPDGSHFEMSARWWAGNSAVGSSSTGWIGRVADVLMADGNPSGPAAALSVGSGAHPIIRSMNGSTVSMPSADALWAVAGAEDDDVLRVAYQRALRQFAEFESPLGTAMRDGLAFADRMVELELDDEASEDLGYDGGGLSNALRFSAAVLHGEVGVRVMHVRTDGDYDTHDGHGYKHPELMRELDTSLEAFHRDLEQRGLTERVMVMTTSEFGRTLKENSNGGLDHGTASTMLLSGPGTGGRVGDEVSLTDRDDNDDVKATASLESYIGGVVEGWLGIPASEIFDSAHSPMPIV
jgi:uncharacterized protein (DUF1501 family)